MKTSVIKVSQIKPAAYNPRLDLKPGDKAYEDLKRSIAKFGDVEPIVWNKRTGNLVGGHQRFKILVNEMGHKTVDAVTVDLSSNDEKALNLALNKIGGDWEPGALKALLEELEAAQYDLSLTGFGTEELAEVLAHGLTEGLTDPDAVPEAPKEAITKPGDLWIIGKHRLLCGDSAAERDVRFLVGSERPVLMWTDPPYGVDYVGKTKDALRIKNDGKEGLEMLLSSAFAAADAVLAEGAAIYVAHPAGALSIVFGTCFVLQGWRLHETLVWVKHSMVMGHSDYHYKHEPILFGYRSEHEPIHFGYTEGSGRRGRGGAGWFGDNKQTSVFEIPRPKASAEHPTMKPIELVEAMMGNSSPAGGLVFDPFLGSGTTLMAAERMGRKCYGLEIDPVYCDVIVKRWEDFTGKKAVLSKELEVMA